jgi:hypothetical protein
MQPTDPTRSPDPGDVETIEFPNGNRSRLVRARPRRGPSVLLEALGITTSRPVLVVVGGADELDPVARAALGSVLERAAIPSAESAEAVIVDGGTASGVMAALGEAVAAADAQVTLIGVAPAGRVTYPGDQRPSGGETPLEPNHSHLVLANTDEWGGETELLFDLVDAVRGVHPAVVLVAGGGSVTRDELEMAARRGLTIVVLAGTGGAADALASALEGQEGQQRRSADDRILGQLATHTDVRVLPLDGDPSELERALSRLLEDDRTLLGAWRQQLLLSQAAGQHQTSFSRQQLLLLGLGVLVTALVVAQAFLRQERWLEGRPLLSDALHVLIVLVPIVVTALVAGSARWRPGGRWVLLRGTSEALKSEIYRYRTRTGTYSRERTRRTLREVKLAEAMGTAMGALMRTDVNLVALGDAASSGPPSPSSSGDDRMSPLGPDQYIRFRIDTQIAWYHGKIRARERQVRWLRWGALVFGALGTFLAAIGAELWVAVTVAIAGAAVTYLEAMQLETTIMLYNQAATDLEAIKGWWTALPTDEQLRPGTVDRLVDRAERIMQAEHAGWVQEMQDAMTRLRLEQSEAREQATGGTSGRAETETRSVVGRQDGVIRRRAGRRSGG